jgi:hypothetical protein
MKLSNLAKIVALGLAVFMAAGAFANNNNRGTLRTDEAVEISGQRLPAGEYQVKWEGSGPSVELSFMQGKKEVAKVSAKEVTLDQAPVYDQAVLSRSNGKASISEIRFAGKKTAFAIAGSDRASISDNSK